MQMFSYDPTYVRFTFIFICSIVKKISIALYGKDIVLLTHYNDNNSYNESWASLHQPQRFSIVNINCARLATPLYTSSKILKSVRT